MELLLIVVILVIGRVWQEREPGTKVVLSRAGARGCVRVCAMLQLPALRRHVLSVQRAGRAQGVRDGGRGAFFEHPKHPCLLACQASGGPCTLAHTCASHSSMSPHPVGSSEPFLQSPLGCPCLCDKFAAGGELALLTCSHSWCLHLLL